MHWLLLLALLSSTTGLQNQRGTSLNSLATQSLSRQIGPANSINVQVEPGRNGLQGDFDSFTVNLDGFSADRLTGLAQKTSNSGNSNPRSLPDSDFPSSNNDGDYRPVYPSLNVAPKAQKFGAEDVIDILGGIGRGKGDSNGQNDDILGGVLGQVLGRKNGTGAGRIGRIRLRATNFTFQGTRYAALDADLGEIRFDWSKALRGQFEVASLQPGNLGIRLNADQAARLVAPRLPSLRDVKIRFADNRAYVGAKSDFYGLKVPFEVGARLSVQQNKVVANDFRASVAKLRLPSFVTDELTRGLNPLYDFDPQKRWPLAVNLTTATTDQNSMSLRGGVQWLGMRR